MTQQRILMLAALSAVVAIAAGAFGAHGASEQAAGWLRTGGFYQLIHAVAAITLARDDRFRAATMLLLLGATVFALSLYVMAFGGPRWLGGVTPVGGVLMISGWIWIAKRAAS